ncbi:MAG: MoaD/ThiS family protein [Gemmatales bacterium]|nr:MoaD/ThiS family protein [Gemmatales bacterium]MDW8223328.1 MoaD/ThiS family protein [Gemmatales bacterium]
MAGHAPIPYRPGRGGVRMKSAETVREEQSVVVEFLGVPRLRTGCARCRVQPGTLRDVLRQVQERFPHWQDLLDSSGELAPWYRLALDSHGFVRDLQLAVAAGQTVLILSADVGG